jgi:hypothetical protein
LAQTYENHWGLSQGCKESCSWFPSPLLSMSPSSNLPYVDMHCHVVGWLSLTVSQVFLPNRLVHISAKEVTVILCFNWYIMRKKLNLNHSFWIPKYNSHDLSRWQLYLECLGLSENLLY